MKDFILSLQFIFRPSFWLMNEPFDDVYDKFLNELLKNNTFEYETEYTAKLGDYCIWVANYPYDCFTLHRYFGAQFNKRASRLTILRAMEKYKNDIKEPFENYKLTQSGTNQPEQNT